MSDRSPSGCARETSVRDQCHTGAQTHTCDGRCRIQHFSHTRTALWSFIADNHNISRYNLAALDCCNGILFAIKDTCRSFVYHHLRNNCRTFNNTAVHCQVALQYRNTACLTVWIVDWADYLRILILASFNILTNRLACCSDQVCVKQSLFIQLIHNSINAACFIELFHICMSGRCQMTQVRCLCTQFIGNIKVDLNPCFMCNCRKMKHCICRTSQGHIHSQCIHKCLLCQDISWTNILLQKFHNFHTGMFCQFDTFRINSRNCAVALKPHTDGFCQTIHTVGCIHTGTGTAGWTSMLFIVKHIFLRHLACCVGTDCFKHTGKARLLSFYMTG